MNGEGTPYNFKPQSASITAHNEFVLQPVSLIPHNESVFQSVANTPHNEFVPQLPVNAPQIIVAGCPSNDRFIPPNNTEGITNSVAQSTGEFYS